MRPKHSLALSLLGSACLIATAALAAPAAEGGRKLQTRLTGAAEVSVALPNGGAGDPDGTGTSTVTVNPGQGRICYTILVRDIEQATMAHIHEAPAGTNGPVVVTLEAPTDGSSDACVDVDRALALEILKDPADYYVNVHNGPYPGGALRGQLAK